MAQVNGQPASPWTSAQTRAQFAAITTLRLRMLRNSLRRKGGIGDILAMVVMVPLFVIIVFLPTVGSGFLAWYFVGKGDFAFLSAILWIIFLLCQLANIQLGQPGTTFDPTQLIRFPLGFRGYAIIRVFFGLISPANVITSAMSLAVAIGITVAAPELWAFAFVSMAAFALCNIFFTRMVFAWIDRWLSTRRAREIFTALIFIGGMSVQYINFTYNPGFQHSRHARAVNAARIAAAQSYYHRVEPILGLLPPGLTSNAILHAHLTHYGLFAAELFGVLAYTGIFFAVFAVRMYKEFRGENLSDVANAVARKVERKPASTPATLAAPVAYSAPQFSRPDTVAAVFGKEFLTLRRNTGIFYALVAPLIMVVLFANLRAGRTPASILFPAAVAYTLMGVAPLCYNSLGLEAAGIQFYFLAPVSMREVFFAKNLMNIGLAAVEVISVFIAITIVDHVPDLPTTLSVFLWAAFTMFLTLAVGNRRSITAPKKIDITKMAKNQAAPLSALISIGLLILLAAVGAGLLLGSQYLERPWLLPPVMLVLAVAGAFVYHRSLGSLDKLLADNRDTLAETLAKAA